MNLIRHATVLLLLGALGACSQLPGPKPDDPAYAPVLAESMVQPPANDGGIFRPSAARSGAPMALFEDARARNIGDIIAVVLSERTTSSKSASSEIKKENSIGLDAGTVLGRTPSFHGGDYTMETAIGHNRDFSGEAAADQRNNLQGSITVMVSNVMPNGLLEVRGEKWLTLNRGEEFIRLRGYIRPEDINPDNTISSTKVADVRITYSGTGELAESNRQGWMSRFFNSEYWPF
jgi:flagellar L-ring protein precursor FlgH